ncbi:hypothetical protein N4310_00995 [Streptococcus danieliae]|nr:hypothetical protein [Streptococcus danieliae]
MKWILISSILVFLSLNIGFAYCCCLVSGRISRLEEEKQIE